MIVQRTTTYAVCPSCGKDAGIVDHLLGQTTKTAWYCDHCGQRYALDFKDGGVVVTILHGERLVKTYDVLVLEPQDKPVYFVVEGTGFEPGEDAPRYLYEEHSCPTNWLQPVLVYFDGDADPHGLIKFVKRVDVASLSRPEYMGDDRQLVALVEGAKR